VKYRLSAGRIALLMACTAVVAILGVNLFASPEKTLKEPFDHEYDVADAQFQRSMGFLLGPALLEGNHVDTLLNGDEIFPAMLEAIRGATRTITFETYIYWSGDIGKAFAEALSQRARAGVKVHVLIDWILSGQDGFDASMIENISASGERYDQAVRNPPDIRIMYLTAWATDDGRIHFRPDIYDLDRSGFVLGQPEPRKDM
jgi:cardiolipin synthase